MATSYTENYYRLASLLVDVGTAVLRRLFLHYVMTSSFPNVTQYLANKKADIDRLHQRKVIGAHQMKALFPRGSSSPDIKHWDISLLSVILGNVTPVSKMEATAIQQLRTLRNQMYGHISSVSLTDIELTKYWTIAHTSINTLAAACNEPAFLAEIHALINDIKDGSLDIDASVDVLKTWYQHDQEAGTRLLEMEEKMDNVQSTLEELEANRKTTDPVFENMKRHSRILIQEMLKQPFVRTEQYMTALHLLESSGSVVIAGKPGEGKTNVALQMAREVAADERYLVLYAASQWCHVDVTDVDVVVLDDVFGKHTTDQGAVQDWIPILETLHVHVQSGNVKVIVTSRDNILAECESLLMELDFLKNKVSLSSDKLSVVEKKHILELLLDHHKRDKSQINISKCCEIYKAPLGFPYSCFLFCADETLFMKSEKFFRRPYEFFREAISGLDGQYRAAFLFLFYKQGQCQERDLKLRQTDNENMELRDLCAEFVGISKKDLTFQTLRESLRMMSGIYITFIDKMYSFAHATIYECMAFAHGALYSEEVITNCTWNFFQYYVSTDLSDNDFRLVVSGDHYDVLIDRMVTETSPSKGISRMFDFRAHPIVRCEVFCSMFFTRIAASGTIEDFLTREASDGMGGFLNKCIRDRGYDCSNLIGSAIPYLQCSTGCLSDCWKCRMKSDAIRACCLEGRRDFFVDLLEVGGHVLPSCLDCSCNGKDDDLVKDVVKELKKTNQFDPLDVFASKAIIYAFRDSQRKELYDFLKQEGVEFTSMTVLLICQEIDPDIALLKSVVGEMMQDGKWKPDDAHHFYSLSLLVKTNIQGYNFLKTVVPCVTTRSLVEAVTTNNVDVVRMVVSDLKEQGHWWPTGRKQNLDDIPFVKAGANVQENMAEALYRATCLEDSAILDYLYSEGMQVTMDMLEHIIKEGNTDYERKVITELKGRGKWELCSKQSGKALLVALKRDKDSFERLKSEGLHFTMDNVADVLSSGDMQCVKLVVEDLKENNRWATNHPMSLAFLAKALEYEDRTIFNYLKENGLCVTTMTIMGEVFIGSVESVKRCVDILKTANQWNPSDPFLNTCLTLTKSLKPDMHALLLKEGVGTSSATLLELVKSKSILAFQTIKDLEEMGLWKPNEDENIKQALTYALRLHNITMYNILVKKGMCVTKFHMVLVLEVTQSLIYSTGLCYKKRVLGVPSLAALSAVPVARAAVEYSTESNFALAASVCIRAFEESGLDINDYPEFMNALRIVCKKCNPLMYNIMADTELKPPPLLCIESVIEAIYTRVVDSYSTNRKEKQPTASNSQRSDICDNSNTATEATTLSKDSLTEPEKLKLEETLTCTAKGSSGSTIIEKSESTASECLKSRSVSLVPCEGHPLVDGTLVSKMQFIMSHKTGTLLSMSVNVIMKNTCKALLDEYVENTAHVC